MSGEALAARLGVSRAAVSKHVQALREMGYSIEASPRRGYSLRSVPDLPLPFEVEEAVTDPIWVRFEGGGVTGSTNDDARALATGGAPEGTVVLASKQTGGRGRLGREWSSPEGGVYVSMVLRPDVPVAEMAALSPCAALGVAEGLRSLGADVGVKWPNDVCAEGRKLAGVLLELSAEQDRTEWVVVGVGVNHRRPPQPYPGAAYLETLLPSPAPAWSVAAAVLDGVGGAYSRFLEGGFAALADDYARVDILLGSEVVARDPTGREIAAGVAAGLDVSGRLVVETASGTVTLSAGDITLRQ